MNLRRLLLLPLALTACSHAEPFGSGTPTHNGPFSTTAPVRLTFNLGNDLWPLWSPDGSMIWYSAQDSLAPDRDHCLVAIPAAGGTLVRQQCPGSIQNNVTEVLQQATLLDGQVAYAVADLGTFPPEHVQYRFNIWTASTAPGAVPHRVMHFPYVAPSGKLHDGPINLRWVRPGMLAYIGFEAGCCNKDTLRFGEQIVLLEVSGDTGIRTFVPDTYRASALGVDPDGNAIYYTQYGDSRVYRRVLATGAVSVIHDFGAGEIIRDPDIVGSRMVAVIRGKPTFGDLPPFDSVQIDRGGVLTLLDLNTGVADTVFNANLWFKRPRLSPGGDRIVAEGYPYAIRIIYFMETDSIIGADTTLSHTADLWLLEE